MGVRFEEFRFADVFTVEQVNKVKVSGKNYVPDNDIISDDGTVPYIAAISINNGITGYSSKYEANNKGDCITLSTTADSSNTVFYQPEDFIGRQQIAGIRRRDKQKMGKYVGLYIVAIVKRVTVLFNYGTKLTVGYLRDKLINLPIKVDVLGIPEKDTECYYHKDGYIPDFEYMERYIAELEQERIAELEQYLIATGLNDYTLTDEDKAVLSLIESRWGNEITDSKDVGTVRFEEFEVNKLFKLQKISHKVDKLQLSDDYEYPAYSSDTRNNGILGYAKVPEFICDEVNRVYLIFGDHTRTMNIARESFAVLDNVKVLIPCIDSDEAILYMCTLWKKCIQDLGYSRHWKIAKDCKLRLPITQEKDPDCKYHKDGYIPDFAFMERYIKAMEKVVIADVVKYKDGVIAQTKALVNT